jgi:phosphoribosylanthranilate isomerase
MSCIDSSLWVKICGVTQPEQAVAIAQLGASAIGFICVPTSPRYVTPLQVRALSQALITATLTQSLSPVERVGVFVDAPATTLAEVIQTGQLTTLQLHGNETPGTCLEIKRHYPHLKLIKAFRIRSPEDLTAMQPFTAVVDALLLDAYHPHLLGGTGLALDWQALATFQPEKPWILAGGLTPENLPEALSLLAPQGIDLSSGVETSPGNKSLPRVQALFEQVRSLQQV